MRGEIIAAFKGDPDLELNCGQIALKIGASSEAQVREWCRSMVKNEELSEIINSGQRARYKMGVKAGLVMAGGVRYEPRPADKAGSGDRQVGNPAPRGPTPIIKKPSAIASLLEEAEAEPERVGDHTELMPVVHKLRLKKMRWKDISQWLSLRGHEANHSGLNSTYKAWIKAGRDKAPS